MFLKTFNSHSKENNYDSSDQEPEKTRQFFKRDAGAEITIGDKIYVTSGELQQASGIIINFDEGG